MRVDIYADEITGPIVIVKKEINGEKFTGLRLYLASPVHRSDDDDSPAVTFWGERDPREGLRAILAVLDAHYPDVRTEESKP